MESYFSFMDFDLSEVASNGCFPVLNIALDNLELYNFDVDFPDKKGNCLLHYAVEKGNIETTNKLLALHAYPDVLNSRGQTALHLSCLYNHNSIAKLLVEHNVKINAIDYHGESPIFLAVRNRNKHLINFLISHGADITFQSNTKSTLLHIAAEEGDRELVEFFIGQGLDVNLQTSCRESALALAIKNGHTEVVEFLLNFTNLTFDKEGKSLELAVKTNKVDICKLLLSQNISDINQLDKDGFSPLHVAAQNNCPDIIKLLVENEAFIDQPDYDDYTPLHVAANNKNNFEAVEILLQLNAKLDLITFEGDLPFHRAAASGNEKAVMLLYRREYLNLRNRCGYDPLTLAEINGRVSTVYLLKNLGASNSDLVNNNTPNKKRVRFSNIPIPKKTVKSTQVIKNV